MRSGGDFAEAALAGSDASGFAAGGLIWLDGAREEFRLVFTEAERRRPINYRELLGALRVAEVGGERLRGRTLLIDLDNSSSVGGIEAARSYVADSQELVRRLAEAGQRHGFRIRSTHCPGEMLNRPDQTSRGVAVEEPRLRVRPQEFVALEGRFGPFTEFVGPERRIATREASANSGPRLWIHPTFSTVGSALRLLSRRAELSPSSCPRGLVLVPWAPEAAWWRLTRHFLCVGRFGVGSRHLEECRLGRWARVSARRPSVLLAFPRAAGAFSLPVSLLLERGGGASRGREAVSELSISARAPLPAGSLLYVPRRSLTEPDGTAAAGCLYLTTESYAGAGRPACAWLRLRPRRQGGDFVFVLETGVATAAGGSWAEARAPWRPEVCSLWLVNHLSSDGSQASAGSQRRFVFDVERAESETAELREPLALADMWRDVRMDPELPVEMEGLALDEADDLLEPMSSLRTLRRHQAQLRDAGGTRELGAVADSGDAADPAQSPGARSLGSPRRPRYATSPPRVHRSTRISQTGKPLTPCRSAGMRCAGCGEAIGVRTLCCPGGDGMIHDSRRCDELATANLRRRAERERAAGEAAAAASAAEAAEAQRAHEAGMMEEEALLEAAAGAERPATLSAPAREVPTRTGSDQRRAQLRAEMSDQRLASFARCLAGQCGVSDETPMICLGTVGGVPCSSRVHGVRCAQISKGHASLGCFRCPSCFARAVAPQAVEPFPPPLLRQAQMTSLKSMSRGAEGTGASYSDFLKSERHFMDSLGDLGVAGGVLPRDSRESFMMWLTWLVTSAGRALSFDTLFRTAGAVGLRTRGLDMTRDPEVRAHYADLKQSHGEESQPRTAVTRRMVRYILDVGIDAEYSRRRELASRLKLTLALEVCCGLRVGEVISGGDFHGLLANHLCILHNRSTGEETIEGLLEHSKTKHKRYVNALGVSRGEGKVRLAAILREYWSAVGFAITEPTGPAARLEGGYGVEGPNYYVVRLSLLGMNEDRERRVQLLGRILARSGSAETRRWAAFSEQRAMERLLAEGSMDKRYVNVTGGARSCSDTEITCMELERAGFGGFLSIAPGPLVRSTRGLLGFSHMPLVSQTTYEMLHKVMEKAFVEVNRVSPDPELDLNGRDAPLWGHHSFRRFADTVARATMAETGATEQDIDLLFGWMEAFYSQKMQIHYEAKFVRERRCRVTSLI